jgi:DNA-binding PucR family transcriptional regulator
MTVARPRTLLSRVLDDLGSTLLDVVAAPGDLDPVVRGVVLYDPHDEFPFAPGDLLLGVGVRDPAQVVDLLRRLGLAGAAALVVKAPVALTDEVRAAVSAAGVALLGLTRAAQWLQVASLLQTNLADDVGRPVTDDEDLAGVPAGDLFALANAVSALLDAPVTIEDRSLRVLAYSGRQEEADAGRIETILSRQVPERYHRLLDERGHLRALFSEERPVYVPELVEGMLPRVAVAVRAGGELLGSIWAAVRAPLSAEREQALVEVSRVVALHLLRHRAGADVGRRLRADLLATVLEGGPGLAAAAARLGIAGHRLCVLAAAPRSQCEGVVLEAARQRLADALALPLAAVHPRAAVALIGGVTYAVVPLEPDGEDGGAQALRLAEDFVARTSGRGDAVVGIGDPAGTLHEVSRSRAEAERVLRVLRTRAEGRSVARMCDVQLGSLLLTLSDIVAEQGGATHGPVAALLDYDMRHQTNFVPTVLAWLDSFGNVNEAAAAVHVHPNTFRYRLRRLCEISGLDLDDPDQRLAVMLQLRLHRLASG